MKAKMIPVMLGAFGALAPKLEKSPSDFNNRATIEIYPEIY